MIEAMCCHAQLHLQLALLTTDLATVCGVADADGRTRNLRNRRIQFLVAAHSSLEQTRCYKIHTESRE